MEKRIPKELKIFEVDFTVPLKKGDYKTSEGDCFGKEWDLTAPECGQCAERDLCGIIFSGVVDKKAEALEKKNGTRYLDKCDFSRIDKTNLLSQIKSGETTVTDLIKIVGDIACTDDAMAVTEWIKRWHREEGKIRTKSGIVWLA